MAFTGHGHHIEGTVLGKYRPALDRCGGPRMCPRCREDVENYWQINRPEPTISPEAPEDLQAKAKRILINYIDSHYWVGFEKPAFEVVVVAFSEVLCHWTALVATDRLDGKLYVLTHDGDKHETKVEEYEKIKFVVISD